ncbi:MAG: nucleotidyltransferase family protein, partial [Candidatus Rokuibacteriota bacterium]
MARLHEALDALALTGIEAIALKGPTLAEALWPVPAERPFTDLDLFVHERDRVPAVAALTAIGYRHLSLDRSLRWELAHGTTVTLVPE